MPALPPGMMPVNHSVEVARAHVAAAERGRSGESYILNGDAEPLARIFREMARLMGIELKAKVLPRPVFKTMGHVAGWVARVRNVEPDMTPEMADLLCRPSQVVTDKAERELGYARVPLDRCLKDSYEWLKSEGIL
jgi:dihydroflavonol-4-reductase